MSTQTSHYLRRLYFVVVVIIPFKVSWFNVSPHEDYSFHNDLLLKPTRGKYEMLKIKLYLFCFLARRCVDIHSKDIIVNIHAAEFSSGFTEQILISTWIK